MIEVFLAQKDRMKGTNAPCLLEPVLFSPQPNFENCLFDYIHAFYPSLIAEKMISICTLHGCHSQIPACPGAL